MCRGSSACKRRTGGSDRQARNLGHWVPSTSGNPGGRPKPPDGVRTRLAELTPRAIERLAKLLDSDDERVRLEAAKTILDRHLGRPAIQADISLQGPLPPARPGSRKI